MSKDLKIINKLLANQIQDHIQKNHSSESNRFHSGNAVLKSTNIIHHINRLKDKSHYWLLSCRKGFLQNPTSFMEKVIDSRNIGMELNITSAINSTRMAGIIVNEEKLKAFVIPSGTR